MTKPYFLRTYNTGKDLPLFIFLPGMDGTGELLLNQIRGLAPYFSLRCLALPQNSLSDWETLSEQVIDLITAELAIQPRRLVYLCGESFGGCLALKVAVSAPQLYSHLVLVNPASSFKERPFLHLGATITGNLPEFAYQVSTLTLLPFLAALGRITKASRNSLLKAMKSVPPQTAAWRMFLLRNFDLSSSQVQKLKQPTLVIAGAQDRLLPSVAEAKRLVRKLPQAQMEILPDSGHACLLERDVRLEKILQRYNFLDTNKTMDQ